MSKTYAVVDSTTHAIIKFGLCADSDLALQPQSGQIALDVTGLIDWRSDQSAYAYDPTTNTINPV